MRETEVVFYSHGDRLAGTLRQPDEGDLHPGIVQGPGWLGLRGAQLYLPYHQALTDAGFAVLIFDYRGFGDSEGDPSLLSPRNQSEDLICALDYLETREDIDSDALGVFGSGGTGGGNAVIAAAADERIRCAVSQVPVADGQDWLRRMRREYEWYEFLERVREDRKRRALTGKGEMVHPREQIMIATPERSQTSVKSDVDDRIPVSVPLTVASEIFAYRPIDAAPLVRNLMVIAVDRDGVTPTDHAIALYDAAKEPKKLILQRRTSHYAAYQAYGPIIIPRIVSWYETHLRPRAVEEYSSDIVEILDAANDT